MMKDSRSFIINGGIMQRYPKNEAKVVQSVMSRIVLVTPEMALEMLRKNGVNRPLRRGYVKRLVVDMKMGKWKMNGEPIIFDKDDRLLDGQHRLQAVISSGVSVFMLIVTGVEDGDNAFKTIDSGISRRLADGLSMDGSKNATALAGAIRWLYLYVNDGIASGLEPSRQQLHELFDEHTKLSDYVNSAGPFRRIGLGQALGGFLMYICYATNVSVAEKFFNEVLSGENLTRDNPSFLLRSRLIQNMGTAAKVNARFIYALVVKAFNAELKGSEMKTLKFNNGEEYPRVYSCPLNR